VIERSVARFARVDAEDGRRVAEAVATRRQAAGSAGAGR
jgi:hypothetical protein